MSIWAYNVILCLMTMVLICFATSTILRRLDEIEKLLKK